MASTDATSLTPHTLAGTERPWTVVNMVFCSNGVFAQVSALCLGLSMLANHVIAGSTSKS
jgi:hypothetical protein